MCRTKRSLSRWALDCTTIGFKESSHFLQETTEVAGLKGQYAKTHEMEDLHSSTINFLNGLPWNDIKVTCQESFQKEKFKTSLLTSKKWVVGRDVIVGSHRNNKQGRGSARCRWVSYIQVVWPLLLWNIIGQVQWERNH